MIFNITVKNVGVKDMNSAKVQLSIYKPDGRVISSTSKSITNFKTTTEKAVQLTYKLPPTASLGTWTYGLSVYYTKTLVDEISNRPFTVESLTIAGKIISVTSSPDPMVRGGTASITVNLRNTGNMVWPTAKITVKIYKPDGKLYGTYNLSIKNLPPNVDSSFSIKVKVAPTAPSGTYNSEISLASGAEQVDMYKGTIQVA